MDFFKYIVVGSGPSGISAALQLKNEDVCIVDVGRVVKNSFLYETLDEAISSGAHQEILGESFETLEGICNPDKIHMKLRSPSMRHVMSGQTFQVFDSCQNQVVGGVGSYAQGGMSNAWGAQLFRYTDADLLEAGNWPLKYSDLQPYYDILEQHIGLSGEVDDISAYLGDFNPLMPPIEISSVAEYLLSNFKKNSELFKNRFTIGKPRLAVLTKKYRGYESYLYGGTEFFTSNVQGIYKASRTLQELKNLNNIKYLGGYELIDYSELADCVEVRLREVETSAMRTLRTSHLFLGCGTLQTSRIVLQSECAHETRLPFIDHPPHLLPFIVPKIFSKKSSRKNFPVQLVACLNMNNNHDLISLYSPNSLLLSDLLMDIPLPMSYAIRLLPTVVNSILVAQIWTKNIGASGNKMRINSHGKILIDYSLDLEYSNINELIFQMRKIGAYSNKRLIKKIQPGFGYHHCGTLPMRERPGRFETHLNGLLWNSKRVRVVDGSVLPSLPAKNHSFTMMANAARVANEALICGY